MNHELGVSREANATLKEEYEILEERFKKHSKMIEDQNSDLENDLKNMATKCKKLQDFYDKHDAILQEERSSSQKQIIQLSKDKDDLERHYKKELDVKTTALETLEGEFQVKMMKIRLMELELENKLTDNAEAQEERESELILLKRDLQKLKTETTKQANTITYLRGEKD